MLFKEEQLTSYDGLAFLDSAVYLYSAESRVYPQTIPITENSRLGYAIVRFDDVLSLQESMQTGLTDALATIAETNGIDYQDLRVAIDETDIILNPELYSLIEGIVILPISSSDPIFQLCQVQSEAYLQTMDEEYLDYLLEAQIGGEGKGESERFLHQLAQDAGQMFGTDDPFHTRDEINKMPGMYSRFDDVNGKKWNQKHLISGLAFHMNPVAKAVRGEGSLRGNILKIAKAGWKQSKNPFAAGKAWASATSDALGAHLGSGLNQKTNGGQYGILSVIQRPAHAAVVGTIIHPVTLGGMAIGAGALAVKGLPSLVKKVDAYRNRPKTVIARKIASLRRIYQEWMHRAQSNRDSGMAAKLKKGAATILQIIDRLLSFIQRKTDR